MNCTFLLSPKRSFRRYVLDPCVELAAKCLGSSTLSIVRDGLFLQEPRNRDKVHPKRFDSDLREDRCWGKSVYDENKPRITLPFYNSHRSAPCLSHTSVRHLTRLSFKTHTVFLSLTMIWVFVIDRYDRTTQKNPLSDMDA